MQSQNSSYEIERKFLINTLPANLDSFPHYELEQGYLETSPVVRLSGRDDDCILTYKSAGLLKRQEVELPLTKSSYERLIKKCDGLIISKTRYTIPDGAFTIELDVFHGALNGFVMAEVEFASEEEASSYAAPSWFACDVTSNSAFHNGRISKMTPSECEAFISGLADYI